MNLLRLRWLTLFCLSVTLASPVFCRAGLYDDDAKNATTGELNDQDYWWTKFDMMMLDLAIKQHQPEGHIAVDLASTGRRLDDLAKKYPKHEEIQKFKSRVAEVQAKIDPNADRGKPLDRSAPGMSQTSRSYGSICIGRSAFAAKDYDTAESCMQNVMQNYEIMLRPDRMKNYPEELRQWGVDAKPVADKLDAAVKEKTHS